MWIASTAGRRAVDRPVEGDAVVLVQGDLVLAPKDGTWKIDGYDLHVTRDSAATGVTTTSVAKP